MAEPNAVRQQAWSQGKVAGRMFEVEERAKVQALEQDEVDEFKALEEDCCC